MKNEQQATALKEDLLQRIEGVDGDLGHIAIALTSIAVELFAKAYPPALSKNDKILIKENYPSATDVLIKQRAMSDAGTVTAVLTASHMARIAIDYSPTSHIKKEMSKDFELPEKARNDAQNLIQTAFNDAEKTGISTFGVATMMILVGMHHAQQKGVNGLQLVRPLVDALDAIKVKSLEPSREEVEDQILDGLCKQMDISKATARKYLAMAKKQNPDL